MKSIFNEETYYMMEEDKHSILPVFITIIIVLVIILTII